MVLVHDSVGAIFPDLSATRQSRIVLGGMVPWFHKQLWTWYKNAATKDDRGGPRIEKIITLLKPLADQKGVDLQARLDEAETQTEERGRRRAGNDYGTEGC